MLNPIPNNNMDIKIIFVGRSNDFNRGIIDWINTNFNLLCVFFIDQNNYKIRKIFSALIKRTKRLGVLHVFDELLFRLFYLIFIRPKDKYLWKKKLPLKFTSYPNIDCAIHSTDDIHAKYELDIIQNLKPDLILSVCTNTIFKKELFNIPKYGMFMLHEGITPEYKGLHTIIWSIIKRDYEYFGYTFFKIDENIDGGRILCQNAFSDAKDFGLCWGTGGHLALINGLAEVKDSILKLKLNNGNFQEISQLGRIHNIYSWVTLSEFFKLFILRNFFKKFHLDL
jgi:hypothetical protein